MMALPAEVNMRRGGHAVGQVATPSRVYRGECTEWEALLPGARFGEAE